MKLIFFMSLMKMKKKLDLRRVAQLVIIKIKKKFCMENF